MSKILFTPFSVLGGLVAGFVGKKLFERLWAIVDEREPPDPKDRDVTWRKVVPALLLEGAVFRVVRGVVDRGLRVMFSKLAGRWPGQERPEPS